MRVVTSQGGAEVSAERETWWAESIVGANGRRGLVQLTVSGAKHTLEPEEARAYAYSILAAAEAAEMDGVVVAFLTQELNAPIEHAVVILRDFRRLRDEMRLKAQQ